MTYTWVSVNNKWKLILHKKDKNIDTFYLPKILGNDFFKAIIDKNGKLEKVGRDIFRIFFDKETDAKFLVEEFLEPRFLMQKMEGKIV